MTIDDVHRELDDVRHELNGSKLTLFRARALYRRLGELARLEAELEDANHKRTTVERATATQ